MTTELQSLTEDERGLLQHLNMFGSDGYPVRKLRAGSWTWDFRGIKAPVVYATKRAAIAAVEAYQSSLITRSGAEAQRRALAVAGAAL